MPKTYGRAAPRGSRRHHVAASAGGAGGAIYILESRDSARPNERDPTMALSIKSGAPSILIRRKAYEASGLVRAAIDARLRLTPDEFRVEGELVVVGPIYGGREDAVGDVITELENLGLAYFDDFFEMTGNWPDWLNVLAASA